ncbi:MAG: hypothetical protein ACLPSL_09820 [Smithella sp.]
MKESNEIITFAELRDKNREIFFERCQGAAELRDKAASSKETGSCLIACGQD